MKTKSKLRAILAGAIAAVGLAATASPSVDITGVQQRYPWNNKVDIDYSIAGAQAGKTYDVAFTATVHKVGVAVKSGFATNLVSGSDGTISGRYTWDAGATAGTGTDGVFDTNASVQAWVAERASVGPHGAPIPGAVQLWAGGPKWAEWNVGASKPSDAGYYFWWGDTIGYVRNSNNNGWVRSDGKGGSYEFSDTNPTTFHMDLSTLKSKGYVDKTSGNLATKYDAARVHFGGTWRMPSKSEVEDLIAKTTRSYTTVDGVGGWLVKGKGDYATRSIFIPFSGYAWGNYLATSDGSYYWTSTPGTDRYNENSVDFYFESNVFKTYADKRSIGFVVRPVQ